MILTPLLNQFNHINIDRLYSGLHNVLGPTVSLCHQCHTHVPAYTYHNDNKLLMAKSCRVHGITHHILEEDYEFYSNLVYTPDSFTFTKSNMMTEVTDRCNADCPHCYHVPDSSIPDTPIETIVNRIKSYNKPHLSLLLAGAEPALRQDFPELISELMHQFPDCSLSTLTNGIRFSSREFVRSALDAGLQGILVGLNHHSYLNNPVIRQKQLDAIRTIYEENGHIYYIGYTMASISELHDILDEIIQHDEWTPKHFRIRYGSDIGRYPDQPRMYVSTIYKHIKDWCNNNGVHFEDMPGDNNLYHTMVKINNKPVRVIQWCDETDINMEELRTGPYCDFVPDGLTNFLHQIIRRDVWKNQHTTLPDTPPSRYMMDSPDMYTELDLTKI